MRGEIRLCQRRIVAFVTDREVGSVHFQDGFARALREFGDGFDEIFRVHQDWRPFASYEGRQYKASS
ncbi:MAG: hypothetical protein U5K38_00635 [Woeseiaceae bacterium]|nr:hypothetical protein [Woeseiaceae bacterium]